MSNKKERYVDRLTLARARELRRPMPPAEEKLWRFLRGSQLEGFKFRRQHPMQPFILDFYCEACKLVIELDGESHSDQLEYDTRRTKWLQERGCSVMRIPNSEVLHNMEGVIEAILMECQKLQT